MAFEIRRMEYADREAVALLIHRSLNAWYLKNRGFELVSGPPETMLVFSRVYEALDPGCCVLAIDPENGRIAGSCFFHPRSTHVALGIMNVDPDYFGRGAGGTILREIVQVADEKKLPLRLVSSAMNLESFSLYNRYGFVPFIFFQDMTVKVPQEGFEVAPPDGYIVRDAQSADIAAIVALERELCAVEREKDWRFFLENADSIWGLSVLEEEKTGHIDGVCASVLDPGSHMVGPGVARTEEGAAALIRRELNRYPGNKPVWLIPSDAPLLRSEMFALGAINCETHIAQVRGAICRPTGIVLPSFMPETA